MDDRHDDRRDTRDIIRDDRRDDRRDNRDSRRDAEFEELVRKADQLFSDDRYVDCVPLYEQALQMRPNHLHLLFFLGRTFANLNQFQKALHFFDKVIDQRSDHIPAISAKGYALGMIGRYDESLRFLDRALELGPNHARTLARKGVVLEHMGHKDDAVRFYDRALHLNPKDTHTLINKGKLLVVLGRYRQAIEECFDVVMEYYPEHAVSLSQKAISYMNMGRTEEGLHMLDRFIRMPPQSPKQARLMRAKGVLLYSLKRYQDALTWYENSLIAEREHIGTVINKGLCLYVLQRYEEALRTFDEALRTEPNNKAALEYRHLANTRLEKRKARVNVSGFESHKRKLEDVPNLFVKRPKLE
jgi:tetratricopeptide (TPR) repeat protein